MIFSRKVDSSNSVIQIYSVKQQFISEAPLSNIRYQVKFFRTYKKYYQKVSKTTCLLRKFRPILPRVFLLTVYKTFIRSRLDYTNIVCDQDYNSTFHNKLKSVQQSACLIYQENICSNALFVQGFV